MYKQTLISALLVSSLSFSTLAAAPSAIPDLKETTTQLEQTVIKFTCNTKVAQQRILAINDQTCTEFPFTRTAENNADQIAIKKTTLSTIDTWFFRDNKSLKKVSFEGSTINLEPFAGHTFLEGCESIDMVSFKGTTGVDLSTFLEQYASPTLLQRILDRKCKLYVDMTDTGATMKSFSADGVVTQDAIHFAIKTSKILDVIAKERSATTSEKKPKGWV